METCNNKEAQLSSLAFSYYLADPDIKKIREEIKRESIHSLKISFHNLKRQSEDLKRTVLSFLDDLPISDDDRKSFISLYVKGYSKRKLCDYPIYEKEIDRGIDRVLDEIGKRLYHFDWEYPGLDYFVDGFLKSYEKASADHRYEKQIRVCDY